MNREIKFRAWDKLNKRWLSNENSKKQWYIDPELGIKVSSGWDGDDRATFYESTNPEQYEVCEFTGIYDRNKKPIYEGDILNVFDWGYETIKHPNKLFGTAKVEWDETEKGWRHTYCGIDIDAYDMFRNVEVTGDIFQNPELLK